METSGKWINASERLPDLFALGFSLDVLTLAGTKMAVKCYDHELKQWGGSQHITVTHWMPLPSYPDGKTYVQKIKKFNQGGRSACTRRGFSIPARP